MSKPESQPSQELQAELAEQVSANRSAVPHYDAFATHRDRLTALVLDAARRVAVTPGKPPTLCVLGAGNGFDLDWVALTQAGFAEIHLVDLDGEALRGCQERQDAATRQRLVLHVGLDLSGMLDRLGRWQRMQVTPAELMAHAERTAASVRAALGQAFDVVLSACMLSQMQLSIVRELGAQHRLFEAARMTLTLAHLRTLVALLAATGTAIFATDVSADAIAAGLAARASAPGEDARGLVHELASRGQVFQFAHPGLLRELAQQDPELHATAHISELTDAWIWKNGPAGHFLVYALELHRLTLHPG